ncbi:MAG: hypothetical protein ABIC36_01760 [bacterium]
MPKKQKCKTLIILWKDAVFYRFYKGEKTSLTLTKCQGEFVKEDKNFIILKNCQQFVLDKKKKKYILKRKANFFFIPKGMIDMK